MAKLEFFFEFKNNLSNLDQLRQHCEEVGNSAGLPKKSIFQMNLALDELFTNIISYGFKDDTEHLIKIKIVVEDGELKIRIEDDGIPFNPMDTEAPDLKCSIEDCKIGGLGIFFIKKMMDEICYERDGNLNILCLKKCIDKAK